MRRIETNGYSLEVGSLLDSSFSELLSTKYATSKKIIIVDENTHEHCLSYLITNFEALSESEIVVLTPGEDSKQMSLTYNIWEALTEYGVTRYDLIINLGGGVITDMGGFIASCYKRGCDFINIPTSLLAMVDASIGGKTGINLGHFKNQIGVFSNPVALYIDRLFLDTLPEEEMLSGFAEMLKHGLISDEALFHDVCAQIDEPDELSYELLVRCIEVKNEVVKKDPLEDGHRKILNFGHTVGHAIEGHYMNTHPLSHGHAVAIGMVLEAYVSVKMVGLSQESYDLIEKSILSKYPIPKFSNEDIQLMIEMMQNDKKNRAGKIKCCLLPKIGSCTYDHTVTSEMFLETLMHFKNKQVNLN
jgi:3-dehydroquinate synthase